VALPDKYKYSDDLITWLALVYDELSTQFTTLASSIASLSGYVTGCIPSNGTDATNDIDFSSGLAFDGTDPYTVGAKTKRADAGWAAGTAQGGMASSGGTPLTFSATTDYHHFLLLNPTTRETDFGFDTSVTATNLLSTSAVSTAGFTVAKRISSLRTGGSAAWPLISARELNHGQVEYLLKTPVFEINKNWSGADNTAQTGTLAAVPGGIKVDAILGVMFQDSTAASGSALLVTSLDQTDTAADSGTTTWVGQIKLISNGGGNSCGSTQVRVMTSTSRTFRYRGDGTTADHDASFCSLGWVDSR
jgi:hypothetical protein